MKKKILAALLVAVMVLSTACSGTKSTKTTSKTSSTKSSSSVSKSSQSNSDSTTSAATSSVVSGTTTSQGSSKATSTTTSSKAATSSISGTTLTIGASDRKFFAGMTPGDAHLIKDAEWNNYVTLGVKTVRVEVILGTGLGGDINDPYFDNYDAIIQTAIKKGMEVTLLVDYQTYESHPKTIVSGSKYDYNINSDYLNLLPALGKIVPHFVSKGVKSWEIWNEQNGMWRIDPQNYMDLLSKIYEKFKYTDKWDPTANICMGGIDCVNVNFPEGTNSGTITYINQCLTSTAYNNFKAKYNHVPFDAIGLHPYNTIQANADGTKLTVDNLKPALDNYISAFNSCRVDKSIPIWITELGDKSASTKQKAAVAAAYIKEAYSYTNGGQLRIARLDWFKYYFMGEGYRIVDNNFNPLPDVFDAIKNGYAYTNTHTN
jgi:hypothetical protein